MPVPGAPRGSSDPDQFATTCTTTYCAKTKVGASINSPDQQSLSSSLAPRTPKELGDRPVGWTQATRQYQRSKPTNQIRVRARTFRGMYHEHHRRETLPRPFLINYWQYDHWARSRARFPKYSNTAHSKPKRYSNCTQNPEGTESLQ